MPSPYNEASQWGIKDQYLMHYAILRALRVLSWEVRGPFLSNKWISDQWGLLKGCKGPANPLTSSQSRSRARIWNNFDIFLIGFNVFSSIFRTWNRKIVWCFDTTYANICRRQILLGTQSHRPTTVENSCVLSLPVSFSIYYNLVSNSRLYKFHGQ